MATAAPTMTTSRQRTLFGEIIAQHGDALARLCGGYERGAAQREELLQEIFLALWRSLATYRGDASLRTWMYRVAHNVATTHIHRAKRRPKTSGDAPSGDRPALAATDTPDTIVEQTQQLKRLHQAIHALRPLDRQLILLTLEELPQADIAAITGLSASNVSTRVGRIKAKLTAAMRSQP